MIRAGSPDDSLEKINGATMLTLYDFGNSVCCQRVQIMMKAKGIEWQSIKVDLFKAERYDPKYLMLNSKGIVPTLVHDGKAIIESTLICEYLDDVFPELNIPADPWLRGSTILEFS
jgi:glutathione S-transferase